MPAPGDGELSMLSQGAELSPSIGTSVVGDDLMLQLGAETLGVRSFRGRRWLLHWEALLAMKGGYLANEHPFLPLLGGYGRASGELGYRFRSARPWSGYVGVRAEGDLQAMASPGVPADALNTLNDSDGFGGITAHVGVRLDGGASFLDARRSLLLVAFVQEAIRTAEIHTGGAAFLEGGLAARLDIVAGWNAAIALAWGKTPAQADGSLALTDQATHEEVSAGVRRIFANRWWLGVALSASQDSDHLAYAAGRAFDTTTAPTLSFAVVVGLPLGAQR
jgi:hypothetical protein